jgi:hypothetical protein
VYNISRILYLLGNLEVISVSGSLEREVTAAEIESAELGLR